MITRFTAALVTLAVLLSVLPIKSKAYARSVAGSKSEAQVLAGSSFKIAQQFRQYQQQFSGYLSPGGTNTYTFQGQAGESIRFSAESQEFPTAITVKNLKGKILARDATSSSIPTVSIALPSDGLYLLEVSTKDASSEGNYTINTNGGRHFFLKEHQFRGNLSPGVINSYTFQGQAGELVRFSTDSKRVPTVITLKDSSGNILAQDDSRSTTRSSPTISLTLPSSGIYTLEISSIAASRRGNYTLNTSGGIDFKLTR